MPFYAYRCDACGHAQDVLQKMSDPVLTTCPACGAERFTKQVTAAGFQLKGSGWYVTDFRPGNNGAKPAAAEGEKRAEAGGDGAPAEKTADKPADSAAAKPAEKAAAPAATATPAPAPAAPGPAPAAKP
jgi:putative FmdB family regulatory protein